MLVLAFDTASDELALAVASVREGTVERVCSRDGPARRAANQVLLSRASEAFEEAGCDVDDVGAVVVGRGPGSFTGVRIGVATAKGLSCGLGVPLYGVSTLDAIAWKAWRAGVRGKLGVVEDAMRKEVYPVRFLLDDTGMTRLDADSVARPADVAARWRGEDEGLVLAGNGLRKYAELFEEGPFELADESLWVPDGAGLVEAYLAACERGEQGSGDPVAVLPVYTRLSDAEENERAKLGDSSFGKTPQTGVADVLAEGGVFLHPMSVNDVGEMAELERRLAPSSPWDEEAFANELGCDRRSWWVARREGELVGYAGGKVAGGELELSAARVGEESRRRGIGTRLVERVASDGRDFGADSISAEISSSDEGARSFCRALGLKEGGERDGALVMRGSLPLSIDAREGEGSLRVSHPDSPGPSRTGFVSGAEHPEPLILAIETSCDETAASIVDGERHILSDVVASQVDFHSRFGGVVPEIASRKHIEAIVPTVVSTMEEAHVGWDDLSAIAVTQGPGLVGALVVGLAFAKGASFATGLPLVCVNHLEGHLYANRFVDPDVEPPFMALLVSGGHTLLVHVKAWGDYEVIGSTVDDAVGEAFDKVAKALGLGYPGGPVISRYAERGNSRAVRLPRAMMNSGDYKFSLSGLKTAVVLYIQKQNEMGAPVNIPDLAASFQAAVVDVLVAKSLSACEERGVETLCIGGGVAANPALRSELLDKLGRAGIHVVMPELSDCTDNASMIASVALDLYERGEFARLDADPVANMPLRHA